MFMLMCLCLFIVFVVLEEDTTPRAAHGQQAPRYKQRDNRGNWDL